MILIISKTNSAEIKYSVKVSLMRTYHMVVLKTWKTTKCDIFMLLAVDLLPEAFSFKY